MNREFNRQLRNTLKNLSESNPDEKIWERIDSRLNFEEQLKIAIPKMPVFEPKENVWQNIETKLDNKKSVKLYPSVFRYLSIAAGIALIFVLSLIITQQNKETVTKTVEIADSNLDLNNNESDKISDQAVAFINEQCKSSSYLCEVPDFQLKQQELNEVLDELKKINEEMAVLGGSSSLYMTKTKLENLKTQLIKDLVKQVTS